MADSVSSRRAKPVSSAANASRSDDSMPQVIAGDLKILQLLAAGLAVLFVWAYWSTLVDVVAHWNSSPDYSHGFLVAPLAAYFLWARRDSFPRSQISPSWLGLSLVALAGTARVVSARMYFPEVDGWSIPLWIAGAVWVCAGWRTFLWAAPSIAFLWFMVPLPATVETLLSRPLQLTATRMSTWVLECLGQPALAEGTTILLNEHNLEVERACSGLRMFYGILALAVAWVMLTRASWRRTAILVGSVLPIALIANTARIVITGLLYQWASGEIAQKFSHDFAGILMILLSVGMFAIVSNILSGFERRLEKARSGMMLAVASYLLVFVIVIPAVYLWHSYQQDRNVRAFLTRASVLEAEGKFAQSAEYLDRYLRVRPGDAEIQSLLARTFDKGALSINHKSRALDLYRDAWAANPSDRELGKRHAQLALDLGRPEVAIESADRLIAESAAATDAEGGADHAAAARYKALAMISQMASDEFRGDQERWKVVVGVFEDAMKLNPADIELAVRLAEIYRRRLHEPEEKERIKIADRIIDNLVERNAEEPVAYLARYDYRTRYRPETAAPDVDAQIDADLDRAIEIGRQHASRESLEVTLAAGARASRRKDIQGAEAFYRRATELQPRDYRGWLRLGEVEFEGNTKEAREKAVATWKQGVAAIGRQEIQLVIPIIGALIDLGRIPEAEEQLRPLAQIIAALSEPAKSSMQVGVALLQARIKATLDQHGDAAAILKKFLAAEVSYEVAQRLKPQYARVWKTLGDYYTKLQSPDQAAYAYEQAGRLDTTTDEWHWKAARACETAGRFGDAVQLLESASRKTPQNNVVWVALARVSLIQQIELSAAERQWQLFERAVERARETGANPSYLAILQSDRLMADEKTAEAVALLEKAIQSQPDSPELWRSMVVVRHRLQHEKELAQAMQQLERCSKNPTEFVLLKAGLIAGDGDIDEAVAILEEAIKAIPADQQPELRMEIAQLKLQEGRRDEATALLKQLSEEQPGNVELLEMRARLALENRDWPGLESIERDLHRVEGESGAVWRDFRARRLLALAADVQDDRFREAVRTVEQLDRARPAWHRTSALRGQIARREGRPAEAITAFENAVRLGNKSITVAEELIDLLTEQRRFAEADRQLNRVRDAIARSSRLSSVAIPIYVRRGESDEALRLAEDWVAREPEDPSSYLRLGRTLLMTSGEGTNIAAGALDRAEEAYRRAVELGPTDVRTWIAMFQFQVRHRQNESAALQMLSQLAERIDILPARKSFVLAQLYESVGKKAQADRYYREAIDLAPEVARGQVWGRAAQFFVAEDPAFAESLSRRALEIAPGSLEARRTLVLALIEQGGEERLAEATALFAKMEAENRQSPADRRLHATLLMRRGRPEDRKQAIDILETLVQIPQQAQPRDRVQLAALYEEEKRIQPAFEQLTTVARDEAASPIHLASFVEFLQRNTEEQPQFASRAESVLERLEADPASVQNAMRLRLRTSKMNPDPTVRSRRTREAVEAYLERHVQSKENEDEKRDALTGLLVLLAREELGDEVIRLAREAKVVSPASAATALANALTFLPDATKLVDAAEPIFATSQKAAAGDHELTFAIGNMRYIHGRHSEAVELYRKVLAGDPAHKLAVNNLALSLAEDPAKLDEALATIASAVEKLGRDAGLLDTQAVVELRRKNGAAARKLLEEAVQTYDSDPLYFLHLAAAFQADGAIDKARRTFQRAIALNVAAVAITPVDRQLLRELEQAFGSPPASAGTTGDPQT